MVILWSLGFGPWSLLVLVVKDKLPCVNQRPADVHEAGVAVLADIHFGTPVAGEGQHIRFSYASSLPAIDEGLRRIADFMKKNTR